MPNGTRGNERIRRAGDHSLSSGEQHAHLECGGTEGGVAFFSNHSIDGKLYEIVDDEGNLVIDVTMQLLIDDWKANTSAGKPTSSVSANPPIPPSTT